ncbi:hypothetical protein OC498_02045 [Acinetobacter bohemicus]|uniref:hypothetical protein n=1 Tax=Acinetobacter TaxID=469 RepID=UPI00209AC084|nr:MULTISPECIES: hypothetical protein [Acinetobacter]MCO8041681.1 hypothetical protein [Acinetobacter sp. S4400-12]MCU7223698.1 hypothetical protein [Acinetobacter bohemicus]
MNTKFSGDLDFPDLDDVRQKLIVSELILREEEIAFSMKWSYASGNSDIWLFDGIAVKKEGIFIAENVIGKKYHGSSGDDDGNTIIFKQLKFDHEYGELDVFGTIKYKAQVFDFEGLLEQSDFSSPAIQNRMKQTRKKRNLDAPFARGSRRNNRLFFITTELEQLPIYFQSYIKENRIFLAEAKKYEDVLGKLNLAKNVLSWAHECKKVISDFEKKINDIQDNPEKFQVFFNDEKLDFANQLKDILDQEPDIYIMDFDLFDQEQQEYFKDTETYFQDIYIKLRDIGYEVYHAWIDAK